MAFQLDSKGSTERELLITTNEQLQVAMLTIDYLTGQVEALITLASALLRTNPNAMKFAKLLTLAQIRMGEQGVENPVLCGHEKAVYWLLDDCGPLAKWLQEVGLSEGSEDLRKA